MSVVVEYTEQPRGRYEETTGVPWHCDVISVEGDRMGDDGNPMQEQLELWRRNPERVYTEDTATIRRYDEMWTADWWWICHCIDRGSCQRARQLHL